MDHDHDFLGEAEVYYMYKVMSNGEKHWIKFCKICNERLSKPFCKRPSDSQCEQAKEYILNRNGVRKDLEIVEDIFGE